MGLRGQTIHAYVSGTGSIARRHAQSIFQLVPDSVLIVLRPRNSRPLPSFVTDVPHIVVPDQDAALELNPDLAVVCSSTAEHLSQMLGLIGAGVPMYVEKPVVATRTELNALREAVTQTGYSAPTLVGCNLRFLPSLMTMNTLVTTGRIGRVVRASFEAGQWLPDWRPGRDYLASYSAHADRGGGVVLDLIHEIDAARWMLGDFDRVQADVATRSDLGIQAEDVAAILVSRLGGPAATISLDYVARRPIRQYRIVGEAGTLTWDLSSSHLVLDEPEGRSIVTDDPATFDVAATYPVAMAEFLESVRSGTATSQPLSEGMDSLDLALRAKEVGTR